MRTGLPVLVVAVGLAVVAFDIIRDPERAEPEPTDVSSPISVPVVSSPPLRVEAASGFSSRVMPLHWADQEWLNTVVVDATVRGSRPVAAANVGRGSAALLTMGETGAWEIEEAFDSAQFDAMVLAGSDLLIFGRVADGPAVWKSEASPAYGGAEQFEIEEHPDGLEELDRAVAAGVVGGRVVVIGYDGTGVLSWWTSRATDEGWVKRTPNGIEQARIGRLVEVGESLYALGSQCDLDLCFPAIWRTEDAIDWTLEPLPQDEPGTVTGLAAAGGPLVAVGSLEDGSGAVWRTGEWRATWQSAAVRGLTDEQTDITVLGIDRIASPITARLLVDGENLVVREGGTLVTSLGDLEVQVLGNGAVFGVGDETHTVWPGESLTLTPEIHLADIAAMADRVVVVGTHAGPGDRLLLVAWISEDGGMTWRRSLLEGGTPSRVLLAKIHIAVVATSPNGAIFWSGIRQMTERENEEITAVADFLNAIVTGDRWLAERSLESVTDGRALTLPGLAAMPLEVFTDDGSLDRSAVQNAIAFVTRLDATIMVDDCDATLRFGEPVEARVVCDFVAESSLLRALDVPQSEGSLIAMTQSGLVKALDVLAPDETGAWRDLAYYVALFRPDLELMGPALFPDEHWSRGPELTTETANAYLEAATELAEISLSPGEVRVTQTPLGDMEISWIEEPFGLERELRSLAATPGGFRAVTEAPNFSREYEMWDSADGISWSLVETLPVDIEWIREVLPFGDGLLAYGEATNGAGVWIRGASNWDRLSLPLGDATETWIEDAAVSGESALLAVNSRSEALGEWRTSAILVLPDGSAHPVELPVPELTTDFSTSLAGGANGFLLITRTWLEPGERVWLSKDGEVWTLMAESQTEPPDWITALEWHDGRFHLFRSGGCNPPDVSSSSCAARVSSTSDGTAWTERSLMSFVSPEQVTSGSLGMVATGRGPWDAAPFVPLLMSSDGGTWALPASALPVTHTEWWWTPALAVGERALIIGIDRDPGEFTDAGPLPTSLLVGRLIDGPARGRD